MDFVNSEVKRLLDLFYIWFQFLVGAFLKKRVDYSHGFSSVFFFRYTWSDQIVLPEVLQNLKEGPKLYLLAQETEPKRLFLHSA